MRHKFIIIILLIQILACNSNQQKDLFCDGVWNADIINGNSKTSCIVLVENGLLTKVTVNGEDWTLVLQTGFTNYKTEFHHNNVTYRLILTKLVYKSSSSKPIIYTDTTQNIKIQKRKCYFMPKIQNGIWYSRTMIYNQKNELIDRTYSTIDLFCDSIIYSSLNLL